MEKRPPVSVTPILRPARRLILRRGITAGDYFACCDEIGCGIWDTLTALPGRLDQTVFLLLPDFLLQPGTSRAAVGAEMPADYSGPVPDGCDVIDLPKQLYLCFQGAPYEQEDWYGHAHAEVDKAVADYREEQCGFRLARELAPELQFGSGCETGCRKLGPAAPLD